MDKAEKDNVVKLDFGVEDDRGVKTVGDALRLHFLLTQALAGTQGKVHYWAFFIVEKLKRIVKTYDATIQKHEDYSKYNAPELSGKKEHELAAMFPVYVKFFKELKEQQLPDTLTVRKFQASWCENHTASTFISAALTEFGLIDDLDVLEKWLFDDKKGNKKE